MSAKGIILTSVFTALISASTSASAQTAQPCAPGSWNCVSAGASAGTEATAGATTTVTTPQVQVQVQQAGPSYAPAAPPPTYPRPNASSVPYVVPAGSVVYVQQRPAQAPQWRTEWGITGRMSSGLFGASRNNFDGSGVVGLGIGGRFRPSAYAAVQVNLDGYGGRDYYGRSRSEAAFGVDGIFFLNPRSRSQFYLVGGIGWASANVNSNCSYYGQGSSGYNEFCQPGGDYRYFGGQLGFGTEFRFNRHWAVNGDIRGFVRTRTDSDKDRLPEFISGNRATNTSGGALLSLGAVLYF